MSQNFCTHRKGRGHRQTKLSWAPRCRRGSYAGGNKRSHLSELEGGLGGHKRFAIIWLRPKGDCVNLHQGCIIRIFVIRSSERIRISRNELYDELYDGGLRFEADLEPSQGASADRRKRSYNRIIRSPPLPLLLIVYCYSPPATPGPTSQPTKVLAAAPTSPTCIRERRQL